MTKKQKKLLLRILLAAVLTAVLQFLPTEGALRFGLYMIPYLVIGWDILKKAALGIWNRQLFDENFLMAVATLGAIAIAVSRSGDYLEAVAVMLFYQTGELFQSCAVGKSRRSISALMDIRPDYANVELDGSLQRVDPEELPVGTEIIVQPGEKIPIDGEILEGSSDVNTAALTGESLPCHVEAGQTVMSGCINLTGLLKLRTTKEFGESTASKILELVENASSRKSRSEAFISKFSRIYTPAVCLGALLLALLPPVISWLCGAEPLWGQWLYRALTFLVISCPCALVISIPLSFFAAIGGAGREGILIKGSNFFEVLSKTDTVVLDKTGTLTRGSFEVSELRPEHLTAEALLDYAAHGEYASTHPIAKSLLAAYGREIDRSRVTQLKEQSGKGISAQVDGHWILVGNDKLMAEHALSFTQNNAVGTVLHVAVDGRYCGCILIRDSLKPNAKKAISALKGAGVRRCVMLTGDAEAVAQQVAEEVGVEEFYARLLPEDKVTQVEFLLAEKKGKLAFVGDGINDAPVLSRADVGIAMGALGSDAAIEAADVVLMDDDPEKIAKAIRIARKCMAIVYENIIFALGIKLLCLGLGALGIAGLWLAIFADVGVMVLAVLNAIRALFVKKV